MHCICVWKNILAIAYIKDISKLHSIEICLFVLFYFIDGNKRKKKAKKKTIFLPTLSTVTFIYMKYKTNVEFMDPKIFCCTCVSFWSFNLLHLNRMKLPKYTTSTLCRVVVVAFFSLLLLVEKEKRFHASAC